LDQYGEESLHNPRVERLMKLIRHVPSANPGTEKMTIRLRNMKELSAEITSRTRRLVGIEDISKKFFDCAGRVLTRKAAGKVRDIVMTLERQADLTQLMKIAGQRY
jgi:hypothetical protein